MRKIHALPSLHELETMLDSCRPIAQKGVTASYIPALKSADSSMLGICIAGNNGELLLAGDTEKIFSMQSIVKILILTCSLLDSGIERVAEKVSIEPSSDRFNDIINLETKNNHKPLNPMINAGAIACLTLVRGNTFQEKTERIVSFAKQLSGNSTLNIDEEVYISEKLTGSRNRAICYYMQSTGVIDGEIDVEALLDAYFYVCSIAVTCVDLARIAQVFANNGQDMRTGDTLFSRNISRVVRAAMVMCGMYTESGSVAVRIGLPTKSGVGGGIISLVPESAGIGIYGPALNQAGSSIAGLALLERISNVMDASIF